MLARGDSLGIQGLRPPRRRPFPAWARAVNAPETEAEAAFLAGAALSRLDAIVRENPPWAGVFRQRLALSAAAASARRAGRTEDEASLRDAFHLSRPGADHGPAGKVLARLAGIVRPPGGAMAFVFSRRRRGLGGSSRRGLQEAIDAAEAGAAGTRPAPFAAARVFALAGRALTPGAGRPALGGRGGEGEAARGLARRRRAGAALKWPFALPLLAAPLFSAPDARKGGDVADGARRVVFAYAKGAARACDLSAELGAAGAKAACGRAEIARQGGRGRAAALLDEDSLDASSKLGGQISERGARRLFDRLVALGAIRELTGRATFRLYGL